MAKPASVRHVQPFPAQCDGRSSRDNENCGCADVPEALIVWSVMRKAPPLPFLPTEWHGREVLVFAACYAGDMAEGEMAMARLRALGNPIADVISPHPFTGWQAAFDPLLTPGARNYWKSHDFIDLPDAAISLILEAIGTLPDPAVRDFHRPCRRCDGSCRSRRDRLSATCCAFHDERAYALVGCRKGHGLHRLG